jgi:hypothetical protein
MPILSATTSTPQAASTLLIVSSRHWQPLSAVDDLIQTLRPSEIVSYGTSAVARRAVESGTQFGIPARNAVLEPGRNSLIQAARQPGSQVAVFVANDVATKEPSAGIAGIMRLLDHERIAYARQESPCTARTCEAVTHLLLEVEKLCAPSATEWRRKAIVKRLLNRGAEAHELRRKLDERLDATFDDAERDDAAFAQWRQWLKSYECLSDALTIAAGALTPAERPMLTGRAAA